MNNWGERRGKRRSRVDRETTTIVEGWIRLFHDKPVGDHLSIDVLVNVLEPEETRDPASVLFGTRRLSAVDMETGAPIWWWQEAAIVKVQNDPVAERLLQDLYLGWAKQTSGQDEDLFLSKADMGVKAVYQLRNAQMVTSNIAACDPSTAQFRLQGAEATAAASGV